MMKLSFSDCYFTIYTIIILLMMSSTSLVTPRCVDNTHEDSMKILCQDGDYILVSVIPLIYESYQTAHLMIAESIIYAIEEANQHILPRGVTLGYHLYNSRDPYLFETLVSILLEVIFGHATDATNSKTNGCQCPIFPFKRKDRIIGIIGTETSHSTAFVSSILSFTGLPIISYWATSIELNDKESYPRVFRTISDDGQLAMILADTLVKLGVNIVSVISTDENYGRSGRQELLKYLKQRNICIDYDYQIELPANAERTKHIVETLAKRAFDLNSVHTVVIFAWSDIAQSILNLASVMGAYSLTWLLSSFDSINMGHSIDPRVLNGSITAVADSGVYKEFYQHFWGNMTVQQHQNRESKYSPKWLTKYEEGLRMEFNVEYSSDITTQQYLPGYVRNAVFSYASAVKNFTSGDTNDCGSSNGCDFNLDIFVNQYLQNTQFQGLDFESISFDQYGSLKNPQFKVYDIFRDMERGVFFQEVAKTRAGKLVYLENRTHWMNNQLTTKRSRCTQQCRAGEEPLSDIGPLCCLICRKCKEGFIKLNKGKQSCTLCSSRFSNNARTACLDFALVKVSDFKALYIIFLSVTTLGIGLCIVAMLIIINLRNKWFVRAMDVTYSLFQIVSQLVLFLLVIYVVASETTQLVCHCYYFILTSTVTLTFSFLLAKSEQLITIFNTKTVMSKRQILINKSKSYMIIFITVMLDLLLTSVIYVNMAGDIVNTDLHKPTLTKEVYCQGRVLTYSKSGYMLFILCVSGLQAFRSRNLPSRFNETKAMLSITVISLACAVTFGISIPLEMRTRTEYSLLLGIGVSITNISILVFTYFAKFWKHLRKSSREQSVQKCGINFETYLKTYKSKKSFARTKKLRELTNRNRAPNGRNRELRINQAQKGAENIFAGTYKKNMLSTNHSYE